MLEVKNLTKQYRPKHGVSVTAVDHISLRFPDRGMVFLLGKSGSGKSTLLNLLGGLDVYDSGEILIKGVSSKSFRQKHFDSYRNTYLGFVFQEYNILEEFNVGANIALALKLQGKKATDEVINRILEEVDLQGYGKRRPSELSGGQKQRVAIARALVKNPEIILADEPTGALDSHTGRQVLDTLKKLSADKLVIVVSHDREFAERYADRIIELADGRVINDVEYVSRPADVAMQGLTFQEDTVSIAAGYHLTEEDRIAINAWLDAHGSGKLFAQTSVRPDGRLQVPTDESHIAQRTGKNFKLIRSRLPLKNAFKIGVSSLNHKKIRLIVTVLLSCVAFGLFGLADTFAAYDQITTCVSSLKDSNIHYASFVKKHRMDEGGGYETGSNAGLDEADLQTIRANTGVPVIGVYRPTLWNGYFGSQYDDQFMRTRNLYSIDLRGFAEIDRNVLDGMHAALVAGRLPDGSKNEIALTTYVSESFVLGGYRAAGEEGDFTPIGTAADLVGKTLDLFGVQFTIVGIVDTGFDWERCQSVIADNDSNILLKRIMQDELNSERNYSLLEVGLVGTGYLDTLKQTCARTAAICNGEIVFRNENAEDAFQWMSVGNAGILEDQPEGLRKSIVWFDSEKTSLDEKEIIVSENMLRDAFGTFENLQNLHMEARRFVPGGGDGFEEDGYRVAGYIPSGVVGSDWTVLLNARLLTWVNGMPGIHDYSNAVGPMPEDRADMTRLVEFSYSEGEVRYELCNAVTYQLDGVDSTLKSLAKVFMNVGIGFAVFASLMLANFIGTSVTYKKQEIGILRAIGARGSDTFRIFFSESFVIAMINFALTTAGLYAVTNFINNYVRNNTVLEITLLTVGPRQILLLLAVSLAVAAAASFLPVNHIARKRPIDAIRNR